MRDSADHPEGGLTPRAGGSPIRLRRVPAALTFGGEDTMDRIKTIDERRAEAVAQIRAAVAELRPVLAAEAARLGGRYLLFGSAARDDLHPDSDVDILVDFADYETDHAAWTFAEDACWRMSLTPDIRPLAWTSDRFRAHVLPEAVPLP